MKLKQIGIELFIVFVSVLGAFLVENRLQSIQEHRANEETLKSLISSIQLDTINLNNGLRLDSITLKERILLSYKYSIWETINKAPYDSLELLLNHMSQGYFGHKINYEILEALPDINNLQDHDLKFKILEYYVTAKGEKEFEDDNIFDINIITRSIDKSTFNRGIEFPTLNPIHGKKTVVMIKY